VILGDVIAARTAEDATRIEETDLRRPMLYDSC
jgi:hypothetical protein